MRKSVLLPFYDEMELEDLSVKERNTVLRHVAEYMMGTTKFSVARNALVKYECHKQFQKVLKELTSDYQKLYRRTLRRFVQGEDVKIHEFDEYHLGRIDFAPNSVRRTKFPTEEDVMKSMSFTVNSTAFKLGKNRKVQRMTHCGLGDLKQIMYMRILSAYRTYLPSLGKILPLKAFYSVLHKALTSSVIDKIREFDTNKSQLTVSFSMLGEDFENTAEASLLSSGKCHASAEEIYSMKETFYMEVPFEDRLEIIGE